MNGCRCINVYKYLFIRHVISNIYECLNKCLNGCSCRLLCYDHRHRITAAEALEHPWFQSLLNKNWTELFHSIVWIKLFELNEVPNCRLCSSFSFLGSPWSCWNINDGKIAGGDEMNDLIILTPVPLRRNTDAESWIDIYTFASWVPTPDQQILQSLGTALDTLSIVDHTHDQQPLRELSNCLHAQQHWSLKHNHI